MYAQLRVRFGDAGKFLHLSEGIGNMFRNVNQRQLVYRAVCKRQTSRRGQVHDEVGLRAFCQIEIDTSGDWSAARFQV